MVGDVDFGAAIETLTARGLINSGDVKKLQDSGINSCTGLMMLTKNTLTDVLGLSKDKVDIIWESAESILVARASERSDRTSLQFPLGIKSYDLKSKIGFGSRGAIVYKAYCKQIKSSVAIKMYNHGHGANSSNSLSPNLLTMSSFSVDWVVMPLMPYGSLRSILYSSFPQGLPESFACFFLSEILKGMLHLHPQHVIITAGNVLVDSNGSVKFSHGSVVEDQYNEVMRGFAKLAMELVGGLDTKHKNEVSSDFADLVSTCMRRRNLSFMELISHKCFNNIVGSDHIRGFLAALPPLEFMAVESNRIIKNKLQTVKNIGRKDLLEALIGKEKRVQELRTSIDLRSGSKGQKEHWEMELASCKAKVDNLKRQLGQM